MGYEKLSKLFEEYNKVNKQREEAYAKAAAEMHEPERTNKIKKAEALTRKLYKIMHETDIEANKLGIKSKRRKAKRIPK